MYKRYQELLPSRYRYLVDRVMNLQGQPIPLVDTLRSIIGLVGSDILWEDVLRFNKSTNQLS
jgi:hypothetical protein